VANLGYNTSPEKVDSSVNGSGNLHGVAQENVETPGFGFVNVLVSFALIKLILRYGK
jgi:hypothetical protein